MNDGGALAKFPGNGALFKFKQKITGSTRNDGTKNVWIMVPLKCLSNFWRTLEMLLINCEIHLFLAWSMDFITSNIALKQATTFAIIDIKLYVPVVTLSTEDNTKLLQKLKNQDSNAQLTGINMSQTQQHRLLQTNFLVF